MHHTELRQAAGSAVVPLRTRLGKPHRYLFFTNECVGLGHFRRTMTVARAVTAADPTARALIVTGSPAVSSYPPTSRVETVKLPQLARDASGEYFSPVLALDSADVQTMRARLEATFADTFAPDVVVVDKTPTGIGGELLPMLSAVRREGRASVVLGLRDVEGYPDQVRRTWSAARMQLLIDEFYDAVLVYGPTGSPDALSCLRIRPSVPVHHVGYVAAPLPLHGSDDLPLEYLLVTLGGGVDGAALASAVLNALRRRPLWIPTVLVTGPLMAETDVARLTRAAAGLDVVVRRFRDDLDAVIVGARAVVTMAGYNTVSEVLRARRPALLVPRVRPSGEQLLRARMLAERGLVEILHPDELDPAELRAVLDRLLARRASTAPVGDYGGARRAADVLAELAARAAGGPHHWMWAVRT